VSAKKKRTPTLKVHKSESSDSILVKRGTVIGYMIDSLPVKYKMNRSISFNSMANYSNISFSATQHRNKARKN
jgi:hypothetical protein